MRESVSVTKTMEFVAVCQYPGRDRLMFYSPAFYVESWSDLEAVGKEIVAREWAAVSPHPAPPIVEFRPGALIYVPEDKLQKKAIREAQMILGEVGDG